MAVVEDESLFGILVAGDTPGNLHQDKLGEYVRCARAGPEEPCAPNATTTSGSSLPSN